MFSCCIQKNSLRAKITETDLENQRFNRHFSSVSLFFELHLSHLSFKFEVFESNLLSVRQAGMGRNT